MNDLYSKIYIHDNVIIFGVTAIGPVSREYFPDTEIRVVTNGILINKFAVIAILKTVLMIIPFRYQSVKLVSG